MKHPSISKRAYWTAPQTPEHIIESRQMHIDFCSSRLIYCAEEYKQSYLNEIADCQSEIASAMRQLANLKTS